MLSARSSETANFLALKSRAVTQGENYPPVDYRSTLMVAEARSVRSPRAAPMIGTPVGARYATSTRTRLPVAPRPEVVTVKRAPSRVELAAAAREAASAAGSTAASRAASRAACTTRIWSRTSSPSWTMPRSRMKTRGRTRASSTDAWPPSPPSRLTACTSWRRRSLDLVGDGAHDGVEELADELGLGGPGHDEQGDCRRPQQDEGVLGGRLPPLVRPGAGGQHGQVGGQVDVEGEHGCRLLLGFEPVTGAAI